MRKGTNSEGVICRVLGVGQSNCISVLQKASSGIQMPLAHVQCPGLSGPDFTREYSNNFLSTPHYKTILHSIIHDGEDCAH